MTTKGVEEEAGEGEEAAQSRSAIRAKPSRPTMEGNTNFLAAAVLCCLAVAAVGLPICQI